MTTVDIPSDYFQAFGLERKLLLDLEQLDKKRLELSRVYHPDRYSSKTAAERQFATDMTSVINDGYRVLRDPARRAEYVLAQAGLDISEQRGKDVPPELLEEVFELNMALEELRSGDEDARAQIETAQIQFESMLASTMSELQAEFGKFDQGDSESLARMRAILNRRRYIQNLINEAERTLSGQAAPL